MSFSADPILQKDVAISTTITSNTVKISGLKEGGISNAMVSKGKIVLNGNVSSDSVVQVKNGDQLQLELISSSEYMDTVKATVSIGTVVKHFQVITDDYIPDAFSFTSQKDVAIDSIYTSNTITVSRIPFPTSLTIEGGKLIKNGETLETDTTSVKNGDKLAVKLLSSSDYAAPTSALVDINGVIASFSITTDDYSPDPFSFTAIKNAKRNSIYTSNTITITGLPYATPAGLARFSTNDPEKGAIYINGKKYTNNHFSLINGDQIWIELFSSDEFSSTITSSLNINNLQATLEITTEKNPWQLVSTYPGEAIYALSGFTVDGKLYLGTGYTNNSRLEAFKEFYEYDPSNNTWTKKEDFGGHARSQARSFSTGGNGYVGLGEIDTDITLRFSDVWKYNVSTDQWSIIPELPNAYSYAKAFNVNDRAFIINRDILWELQNDQWIQKGAAPDKFDYLRFLFSVDAKAYFSYIHLYIWVYDSNTDTWSEIENPANIGHAGFEINGIAYALQSDWPYACYQFNPSDSSWKIIDAPMESYTDKCFSINGKGYCISNSYNISTNTSKLDLWEFTPPQE